MSTARGSSFTHSLDIFLQILNALFQPRSIGQLGVRGDLHRQTNQIIHYTEPEHMNMTWQLNICKNVLVNNPKRVSADTTILSVAIKSITFLGTRERLEKLRFTGVVTAALWHISRACWLTFPTPMLNADWPVAKTLVELQVQHALLLIHRSIPISATCNLFSSPFLTGRQHSHVIISLTTVFYIFLQ